MTGHTAPPRGRVSLLGVIAGGLLIGAGGFGLFRVTNANPAGDLPALPPLPPVSEGRPDPVGLPPLLPAGGPLPVVLPPLGERPKPGEVAPPPAPLPPPPPVMPSPALPVMPSPTPGPPTPVNVPPVGDLPKPGGFDPPALPPITPEIGPAPKPTLPELPPAPKPALPELPPAAKPVPPLAQPVELAPFPAPAPGLPTIQPLNPDFNLRPSVPGNTVTPGSTPAEVPPVPRPAVTVLPAPVGPLDPPPTPGDPPVTLTLRQAMMSAALGAGFALAPTPVLRAEEPPRPQPVPEVDVKTQISDLKKEVAALRKQNEVQADYILGRTDGKAALLPVDLGLLKRVQTLEEAIVRIEKKLDATKQVVGSSPIGDPAPTGGKGTIRLINEYATDVKIVVNGTSHELKSNELKEVTVPAGEFVYELLATGAAKTTSTIKDTERVTLRIR